MTTMATLVVFGGLPGSGKSSIARELARQTGASWLRIDSIEQAIRESGIVTGSVDDAGYRAAYAVADDNLRLPARLATLGRISPLRAQRSDPIQHAVKLPLPQ
jgi:hypothetical protein